MTSNNSAPLPVKLTDADVKHDDKLWEVQIEEEGTWVRGYKVMKLDGKEPCMFATRGFGVIYNPPFPLYRTQADALRAAIAAVEAKK